jgi:xylulokinase
VTVLTLDLGTSTTKAALWSDGELIDLTRAPIATRHPRPGWAEQDPADWWRSVGRATASLRQAQPPAYAEITMIGCSGARETFAPFDRALRPLRAGILWSDGRATDELDQFGDPAAFRVATGVILSPGCCGAKIAWLRRHEPGTFEDAAWLLAPRDLVLARLTGRVRTDPTLASRTGLYDLGGSFRGDDALAARLPEVVPSLEVAPVAGGADMQLPEGVAAILGAGDRCCEAIGVGATNDAPLASWGTTLNVSVPHPGPVSTLPTRAQVSRAVPQPFLIEAGLGAAGAAVDWLARLTGRPSAELLALAREAPPGANGAVALPWLQGARAPWWRPDARAAVLGLTSAHGPAELARALIEGIAFDTARSVELVAPDAVCVTVGGGGSLDPFWREVLAAATRRDVRTRRFTEAASVGARLLVAEADGVAMALDEVNPVTALEAPSPSLADDYVEVRARSDAVAAAVLDAPK